MLLLFQFLLADRLLDLTDLLDQAHQVALADDPLGHALGAELFQPVELLADADELDRHLGDRLDGQRRAAAGVAVHLGHDDAVKVQGVIERLGAVDGVLAGHRVADEVHLVGPDEAVDLLQLVHRHFVDVQPASSVEDDGIEQVVFRIGDRVAANLDRVGRELAVDRHVDLLAEHLQLLDGRGTLKVGGDQERLALPAHQGEGELAGRGRLALALQAAEHDDGRPVLGEADIGVGRPHQGDQLVVNDLDDLLAGVEGAEDSRSERFFRDLGDEVVGDGVVDVGVEQRAADLDHRLADVGLGDAATATELLERLRQASLDALEHHLRPENITATGRRGPAAPRVGGEL